MKCPYCAEEIQDEAVLCRYCGAVKAGVEWRAPALATPATPPRKTNLTIRIAGAFFLLSAAFECLFLTAEVPVFGAVRGGAVALVYHLLYAALFLGMGIGLWGPRPWGLQGVLVGTVIYTIDKVRYLLDVAAREADLIRQLHGRAEVLDMVDKDSLLQMMDLLTVVILTCWWGFAIYLYFMRAYFVDTKREGRGAG